MNKTKGLVLLLALLLLGGGLLWLYLDKAATHAALVAQQQLQGRLESALLIAKQQQQLPAFMLRDHNDKVFDKQRLTGHWSLLFFGYTHCPDVCPTELYGLSTLLDAMKQNKINPLPEVVFISLDGRRDTPASMKKYTRYFHPDFLGVTGEQSAVDALAQFFDVLYETVYYQGDRLVKVAKGEALPADKANSYLINHSAWLYLINPNGELYAVFPSPHQDDVLLRDLPRLYQNQ